LEKNSNKRKLYAQELKNRLRAWNSFSHAVRNILFPVGYLKTKRFKYVEL